MSFKVEVIADETGKWCGNALRFVTKIEAEAYVKVLAISGGWTAWRVIPCNDPIHYGNVVGIADEEGGD